MSKNLKSLTGMEEVAKKKIFKEEAEGRVLGLFKEPPVRTLRVFPLGVVPKKAPGEYRLIHHLSYSAGDAVNDMIPEELCAVQYTPSDAVVHMIKACGPGIELAKCDIQLALHLLPVHPSDFELLGFAFEGCYYMDGALTMGCSISCTAFECFRSFLEWVLQKHRMGVPMQCII